MWFSWGFNELCGLCLGNYGSRRSVRLISWQSPHVFWSSSIRHLIMGSANTFSHLRLCRSAWDPCPIDVTAEAWLQSQGRNGVPERHFQWAKSQLLNEGKWSWFFLVLFQENSTSCASVLWLPFSLVFTPHVSSRTQMGSPILTSSDAARPCGLHVFSSG